MLSAKVEGRSQITALSEIYLSFLFVSDIWWVWEKPVKYLYLREYVLLVKSCELIHYEFLRDWSKAIHVQVLDKLWGFQEFESTRISRHSVHVYRIYLNINQIDALNFIMSLFHAPTYFEHMCSSSGGQNCTIECLASSHLQVAVRCTGRPPIGVMIPEVL